MLYRSNKVMYDRLTNSLWNQLSREPVIGPLWDSGIKLDFFPVMLTTWEEWLELHPDTTVLAQDTGVYHRSFYVPEDNPEAIYFDYFNTPQTMFPVPDRNNWLETKDIVLGVQLNDSTKAYSSDALRQHLIVNDVVGGEEILVLGSATSEGARAYYRGGQVVHGGAERRRSPRLPVDGGGRRRWDVAGDRGVSRQLGGRVGEAGTDTHAHVVLVRVVPVPPGHGALHRAVIELASKGLVAAGTPVSARRRSHDGNGDGRGMVSCAKSAWRCLITGRVG